MRELRFSKGLNITLTGVLSVFLVAVSTVFLIMALGKFTETTGETYTASSGWTFSVYHDEMPLYVQELEDVPDVEWSTQADRSRTPLLERTEYDQRPLSDDPSLPDLSYTVTRVKVPALYGKLKELMLRAERDQTIRGAAFPNHYESTDAAPGGHWTPISCTGATD